MSKDFKEEPIYEPIYVPMPKENYPTYEDAAAYHRDDEDHIYRFSLVKYTRYG